MLGTIFLDYRKDRNVENLHRRMEEITKYWKTILWYEVARQLHHVVGAYVSINTTIKFINKLKVTKKTRYIERFCEYFDSIESDIYTNVCIDNYEA
jgi:CRISPR/Cas system CSM-associated protein Csm2 small subunit